MLDYLNDRGMAIPFTELEAFGLDRELVGSFLDGPLDDLEFTAVRNAVENWEQRWGTSAGEAFPRLLAHALDLRIRVVQYRQHDRATGVLVHPYVTGILGDPGHDLVDVHYNGTDHYDGPA